MIQLMCDCLDRILLTGEARIVQSQKDPTCRSSNEGTAATLADKAKRATSRLVTEFEHPRVDPVPLCGRACLPERDSGSSRASSSRPVDVGCVFCGNTETRRDPSR